MSDDTRTPRLVVVETAKTPFEAQVIAAVLRGAGVPVYVGGSMLADEFAASQRLMGLGGVRVQVPSDRLEDAQEALRESREVGEAMDDAMVEAGEADLPDDAEREVPPRAAAAVPVPGPLVGRFGVALGVAVVVVLLWAVWTANRRLDPDYGPFSYEATEQGYRYRWKANGVTASEGVDRDGNGVAEVVHFHNFDGVRTSSSYDEDQDGLTERTVTHGRDGAVATTSVDADRNGRAESWAEHHAGGLRVWIDTDDDGRFDRIEERDAADRLRRAWRVDQDEGFVPVR